MIVVLLMEAVNTFVFLPLSLTQPLEYASVMQDLNYLQTMELLVKVH